MNHGDEVYVTVRGQSVAAVVRGRGTLGAVYVELVQPFYDPEVSPDPVRFLYRDPSEVAVRVEDAPNLSAPHDFHRRGWRWWLCRHCYAPRALHPRQRYVRSRPVDDNLVLSRRAPHFREGW